jgi:hypothetical protein
MARFSAAADAVSDVPVRHGRRRRRLSIAWTAERKHDEHDRNRNSPDTFLQNRRARTGCFRETGCRRESLDPKPYMQNFRLTGMLLALFGSTESPR